MINKDNSISSRIKLGCRKDGKRTLLTDSYFDIPFKLVHYGSKLLQEHLEIMMMSYSPGVMDGDSIEIDVHCAEKTEMKLFTQSFNKLHPMKNGAKQLTRVRVDDGALFQFLPYPTIPFKDAIFQTTNEIHLNAGSHLIWGDIISGGRIYSGERFQFTRVHSKTKIYHDNKLVFFDNQLLEPKRQPVEDLLFFEGFTHQGTLILVSQFAVSFKEELDALLTEQFTDMSYGFTQCSSNILMIRALGESGEAMHDWLGNIGNMCWSFIKHKTGTAEIEKSLEQAEIRESAKKTAQNKPSDIPKNEAKESPVKKKKIVKKAPAKKTTAIKAISQKTEIKKSQT